MSARNVFISFSQQDVDHHWVRAFARALRDRNFDVWFVEWDVKASDQTAEALGTALRASDTIVAVISGTASRNSNVYFELGVALGANKRLVLVVDPSFTTSIPLDLQHRRWISLQAPEETAREVAEAIGTPA